MKTSQPAQGIILSRLFPPEGMKSGKNKTQNNQSGEKNQQLKHKTAKAEEKNQQLKGRMTLLDNDIESLEDSESGGDSRQQIHATLNQNRWNKMCNDTINTVLFGKCNK